MSERESKTAFEEATDQVRAAEERLQARTKTMKKVLSCLTSARKRLAAQKQPLKDLKKLTDNLDVMGRDAGDEDVIRLNMVLKEKLQSAAQQLESNFQESLEREAKKAGLACGMSAGTFFLGPFGLSIDMRSETSSLTYAKLPIAGSLPIDAQKVAAEASRLADAVLQLPTDIPRLADDFEEAIKIALLRARKPTVAPELRAELPSVYREMGLLRQERTKPLTKSNVREYSIPQFLIDLKTLVQSDFNVSKQRFRLETAVIENTRDAKKSLFIPNDLSRGYGEGTYFQAMFLMSPS